MTSESPTSYFSAPVNTLDPKLFEGREIRAWVRQGIQSTLQGFLNTYYRHSELWEHSWLAGSGVSYQWAAARQPGDLDCLIGVDFIQFRKANPEFAGLMDKEIAAQLNEELKEFLWPQTENWNGYELTFYVNATGTDIRTIKPYAAYDLKYNEWTVTPNPAQEAPKKPEWDTVATSDYSNATTVHTRATKAIQDLTTAYGDPQRRNAETALTSAFQQADAMYSEIHNNRSQAFSPTGEGYADFNNYRWQAAKRNGTLDLLKAVRKSSEQHITTTNLDLYGVDLPDVSTLIRRAATYRNK